MVGGGAAPLFERFFGGVSLKDMDGGFISHAHLKLLLRRRIRAQWWPKGFLVFVSGRGLRKSGEGAGSCGFFVLTSSHV